MSAVKASKVGIRVLVQERESVDLALVRLDQLVDCVMGRPSHKRRYGYYERPSELRRKRAKKKAIRPGLPLHVRPRSALFARTGPSNTLMR